MRRCRRGARVKKPYKLIDHTADIGILVKGKDLCALFENAAFALFDLMLSPATVRQEVTKRFELEAPALDELLNVWLARLLEEFTLAKMAYGRFMIESIGSTAAGVAQPPPAVVNGECQLAGLASGEPFDMKRHRGRKEIKAVTFHSLLVRQTDAGWEAQVIFDT